MNVCEVNTCNRPAVTDYPGFMCNVHRAEWLEWRDRELQHG